MMAASPIRVRQLDRGSPDLDLLASLNAGDPHAMRFLYERYARRVHSVAQRVCRDKSLAEEAVQEAFLTLWREFSRYDPARGTFPAWLLTVVHHKAVDAVRREHTARRIHQTVGSSADGELPAGPGADEAALESVFAGQVRAAVHRLPRRQRQTLLLAYYGGYTHREISELVEVPLGTVKSRMSLGVQRLRTLLRPLLDAPPGTG
jgi:RNA polymerase sigma-70 factor, ECF subfamily